MQYASVRFYMDGLPILHVLAWLDVSQNIEPIKNSSESHVNSSDSPLVCPPNKKDPATINRGGVWVLKITPQRGGDRHREAAIPARVRSRIRLRSNSANAPNI